MRSSTLTPRAEAKEGQRPGHRPGVPIPLSQCPRTSPTSQTTNTSPSLPTLNAAPPFLSHLFLTHLGAPCDLLRLGVLTSAHQPSAFTLCCHTQPLGDQAPHHSPHTHVPLPQHLAHLHLALCSHHSVEAPWGGPPMLISSPQLELSLHPCPP